MPPSRPDQVLRKPDTMVKFVVLLVAVFALAHAQQTERDESMPEGTPKPEHSPMPEHSAMPERSPKPEEEPWSEEEPRPDHEPRPEEGMSCYEDSHCGSGKCIWEDGMSMCRCPKNYFGDHCEMHKPLQCIVCDGFVHEHDSCTMGNGVSVQNCSAEQHYCKTEVWYGDDGIMWLKRHGCSATCWNKPDCYPGSRESCIACCDYEKCFGYESYVIGASGATVVTSGVVSVSLAFISSIFV